MRATCGDEAPRSPRAPLRQCNLRLNWYMTGQDASIDSPPPATLPASCFLLPSYLPPSPPAQSILSMFMAPGSILFEVYPHKYYKTGYAPMAHGLGLRYGYSHSPPVLPLTSWKRPSLETCMEWYWCRKYVRGSDVKLDEDSLEVLISLMLQSLRAR